MRRTPTRPSFEGPVTFHERVTLTRASRSEGVSRNIFGVFELLGRLDVEALREAVDFMIERHESLRTAFVPAPPTFRRQVYARAAGLVVRDFSQGPDAEARAAQWMDQVGRTEHPLHEVPLATFALAVIQPEQAFFAVVADHVIGDKFSALLAWRELGQAYSELVDGWLPELEPAPQPRELVPELGRELAPVFAERSRWIRPWPEDGFRLDPDPGLQGGPGPTGIIAVRLPPVPAIRDLCTREAVPRGAVTMAALVHAFRCRSGRPDVGFSVARSGRRTRRQWDTLGYLVFTDTFLAKTPADAPLHERLQETAAFLEDHAPWRRVYNAMVAPPTRRILLNLVGPELAFPARGLQAVHRRDLAPPPELFDAHDLVVQLTERGDELVTFFAFRSSAFAAQSVQAMADDFAGAMEDLVSAP